VRQLFRSTRATMESAAGLGKDASLLDLTSDRTGPFSYLFVASPTHRS
jgi:hypothetical protein